jgi:TPR repeat protein
LAALLLTVPTAGGADDAPPYASATAAYRDGVNALKAGKPATALPALEYAASRGVLGAQLKLARAYATGRDLPKDDAKAFIYFQQIADEQADVAPSSPIAKYAAEALVALGQYYLDGIPAMPLPANPTIAADLFRHAASYFGNAEAQYRRRGEEYRPRHQLARHGGEKAAHGRAGHARRSSLARPGDRSEAGAGTCLDHARA